MKKNVTMAIFYGFGLKNLIKISIFCCFKKEKNALGLVASYAQKTNITFLCRFVIKYS